MDVLQQARGRFLRACADRGVDCAEPITVRPLSPDEAIGQDADGEFVIKKGKEVVIEAVFGECRGQAFTDRPSRWAGTLAELVELDLTHARGRAVFVAGMNAVMRSLGMAEGTVHCLDQEPTDCGPKMAEELARRFGQRRYGLIGLQPAILKGLV